MSGYLPAGRFAVRLAPALVATTSLLASTDACGRAIELPDGFAASAVLDDLRSPAGFAFSPDERMFICERIAGELRVAVQDAGTGDWEILTDPFYTFDVPPTALRSAGLRDIAFDPDFETNGFVYALYMHDGAQQNRVVRLEGSASNPNLAEAGSETLLIELPANASGASGSHNGGALAFGPDGHFYVTTGDGWNGGDPVQSLSTFTGKVFRITSDGAVPADNPFYDATSGDLRAIYALGLRNPFTMTAHPGTGTLYINDVVDGSKANVLVAAAGANYGHDGYGGIGTETAEWADAGEAGGRVITGGAWYPSAGNWPVEYRGRYVVTMWGGNGDDYGDIHTIDPDGASVSSFAASVGIADGATGEMLKPVLPNVGPDGHLYYALTTYETERGAIHRIEWTGGTVATGSTPASPVVALAPSPNPARGTAVIRYELPHAGGVALHLLDVSGRVVARLAAGHRGAGTHAVTLAASDLAAGVYFARLTFGETVETRKLVVAG